MVGHSGITHCPQVNGVKGTQLVETIFRHHAAGLGVPLATPIETLPRERQIKTATRRLKHTNAFGTPFFSDPVAFDHRYFVVLQDPSQSKSFVQATTNYCRSAVSVRTSDTFSSWRTISITWFAFELGHSANAAQPRNFSATSS